MKITRPKPIEVFAIERTDAPPHERLLGFYHAERGEDACREAASDAELTYEEGLALVAHRLPKPASLQRLREFDDFEHACLVTDGDDVYWAADERRITAQLPTERPIDLFDALTRYRMWEES